MKYKKIKNYIRGGFLYNQRKIKLSNHPSILAIESTNQCNLDCIMCPRKFMTRKIGFMDFSLFKKIINEGKDYTDFVWLNLFGEPLLHPQIIEMINYCCQAGIKPGISTNATVLNCEMSEKLLNSGLHRIILSLDGATKETYEKIRKNANFETVLANVKYFLDLKEKKGKKRPFTTIQVIKMNETLEELNDFFQKWNPYKVEVLAKKFDTWGGTIKEMKPENQKDDYRGRPYPCKWFWYYLVITWDGKVLPCCRDYDEKLILGDIKEKSLLEIWNNEPILKQRRQQIDGDFPKLCKDCPERIGSPYNPFYPIDKDFLRDVKGYLKKVGILRYGDKKSKINE